MVTLREGGGVRKGAWPTNQFAITEEIVSILDYLMSSHDEIDTVLLTELIDNIRT